MKFVLLLLLVQSAAGAYLRPGGYGRPLPDGLVLMQLAGGNFTMGKNTHNPVRQFEHERMPEHRVALSPFQMAQTEVTNAQYVQFLNEAHAERLIDVVSTLDSGDENPFVKVAKRWVVGSGSSAYAGQRLTSLFGIGNDAAGPLNRQWIDFDDQQQRFYLIDPAQLDWGQLTADGPQLGDASQLPSQAALASWPVGFIGWYGAYAFADYYGVALPTEAQWEYAAKGGHDLEYATDDGTLDASKANYASTGPGHAQPVRSYAPNPFGLFDLSGNAAEWCADWFDFYSAEPQQQDPLAAVGRYFSGFAGEPVETDDCDGVPGAEYTCDARVQRGGSWQQQAAALQTTVRHKDFTWRASAHAGFRIVINSGQLQAGSSARNRRLVDEGQQQTAAADDDGTASSSTTTLRPGRATQSLRWQQLTAAAQQLKSYLRQCLEFVNRWLE